MFFIFDCDGNITGNPKGYRTHKGAMRQCEAKGSRIKTILWTRFHMKRDRDTSATLVYSINYRGE